MKYVNGMNIIMQVLENLEEYESVPPLTTQLIKRLLDDLHYNTHRKITNSNLEHFRKYFSHLFEELEGEE